MRKREKEKKCTQMQKWHANNFIAYNLFISYLHFYQFDSQVAHWMHVLAFIHSKTFFTCSITALLFVFFAVFASVYLYILVNWTDALWRMVLWIMLDTHIMWIAAIWSSTSYFNDLHILMHFTLVRRNCSEFLLFSG